MSLELDAAGREAGVANLVVAQVVDEALDVGGERREVLEYQTAHRFRELGRK